MDLLKNPFNLLKVSPRDSQQRIMETVSGDGQGSISQMRRDAAYTLCDPFKRLRAEVAWLPGLGASQVEILLGRLKKAPEMLIREENLLPTARVNLLTSAFKRIKDPPAAVMVRWVNAIIDAYGKVSLDILMPLINAARSAAGFPVVSDRKAVQAELVRQRITCSTAIFRKLTELPDDDFRQAVMEIVDLETEQGKHKAPDMLNDLVSRYQRREKDFLYESYPENLVNKLASMAREGQTGDPLTSVADALAASAKAWDRIARPIRIFAVSRGGDDNASERIAGLIHNTAVDMYVMYGREDIFYKFMTLLKETFTGVTCVAYLVSGTDRAFAGFVSRVEEERQKKLRDEAAAFCRNAVGAAKSSPACALEQAKQILGRAPSLISTLRSRREVRQENISAVSDCIAQSLLACVLAMKEVRPGGADEVDSILNSAVLYAESENIKSEIRKYQESIKREYDTNLYRIFFIFCCIMALIIFRVSKCSHTTEVKQTEVPGARENFISFPYSTYAGSRNDYPAGKVPEDEPFYADPPDKSGSLLTLPQIRSCVRMGTFLELARQGISNARGIEAYNSSVREYNRRCGYFRYRRGDLQQARRDVERHRGEIEKESARWAQEKSR